MKTVSGKILSIEIGVQVEKRDGGYYEGWRLVYRGTDGKTAEIAKPMAGLKYQPGLKAGLETLKAGDEFTAEMEKNDKGYWEVVSVGKGADMPHESARGETPVKKEYKTDRQYETTEERANKQLYIVRQTCLDRACHLVAVGKIEDKNVLKVAEKFEAWVMRKEPEQKTSEVE